MVGVSSTETLFERVSFFERNRNFSKVITLLRDVAFGNAKRLSRRSVVLRTFGRAIALSALLTFTMDALNVDVLLAAVIGQVSFQDNPEILDSAFDTTPVASASAIHAAQGLPSTAPSRQQSVSGTRILHAFQGTIIVEDVDSPTVLDGSNTEMLVHDVQHRYSKPVPSEHSTVLITDRTISFLRILI